MQTQTLVGLKAQLPGRVPSSRVQRAAAIRCMAAPQRQQHQAAAPEVSAATSLALSSLLLGSAPAWADEAAAPAAAAGEASQVVTGVTAAGWALILSPIAFYALFNVYRSQINPRAKFGDAVFVFAALIIAANIFCIAVLKVRLF
ncbi:hypothetical protein ABPG77_009115 [Micractinium sp. CCAP 211/92]